MRAYLQPAIADAEERKAVVMTGTTKSAVTDVHPTAFRVVVVVLTMAAGVAAVDTGVAADSGSDRAPIVRTLLLLGCRLKTTGEREGGGGAIERVDNDARVRNGRSHRRGR